jgi:hypothetical protein
MTRPRRVVTATAELVHPATEQFPFVVLTARGNAGRNAGRPVEVRVNTHLAWEVRAAMDGLAILGVPVRPPAAPLTVALRVTGSQCDLDPNAALLELNEGLARQLLTEMEQVAVLNTDDDGPDRVVSVDCTDWQLTYLADSDAADGELLDDDWALLGADRAAQLRAAQDDELRLSGETRVTTAASVHWRCYPKHGDGEFHTSELSRDDLQRLLQMLLVPEYAHLAGWVDPTVSQPDLRTREGQALWELFDAVMADANQEGISPTSGADDAAALYEVLGRFGLRVP